MDVLTALAAGQLGTNGCAAWARESPANALPLLWRLLVAFAVLALALTVLGALAR